MADDTRDALQWALDALPKRVRVYTTYRDYYRGAQTNTYADARFRSAFGRRLGTYRYNRMRGVVKAYADRLQVTGFQSVDEAKDRDPAIVTDADRAKSIWSVNRMEQRQGEIHQEALITGDAYLLVWPMPIDPDDPNGGMRVTMYPNRADQMTVHYDEEIPGRITHAAKAWQLHDKRWRVTVYALEAIYKYVTSRDVSGLPTKPDLFEPFMLDGEDWPINNEWGQVPVFPFHNEAGIGEFGVSQLADLLPLQDSLNHGASNRLVAGEFASFRQRWVTGMEPEIDPTTGLPTLPFQPGIDKLWLGASPDTRFGDFQETDLRQFLDVEESDEKKIMRASGVPLHYLDPSGDPPSGESLKTMETPFVAAIRDKQVAWGNVWADAMELALRMDGLEGATLSAVWTPAAPQSDREKLDEALIKVQLGYSFAEVQRGLGLSEEKITEMATERSNEAAGVGEVAF